MYCRKCGAENQDHAQFCKDCGAPLRKVEMPNVKKKQKKYILWIAVVVVILAAGIAGILIFHEQKKEKEFQINIRNGQKYLEQMEYKKAEACFQKAIDIDPKEVKAYQGLAETYEGLEDYEKAFEIYEEAFSKVQNTSEELKKEEEELYLGAIEFYDKQGKEDEATELIKEMEGKDQSEEGKNKLNELQKKRSYQAYYDLILEYQEKYGMGKIKTRDQEAFCLEGLCFASLLDFDQNGKEELVLAYLSEMPEREPPIPRYTVEVWEFKKGKVDKVYTGNPYRIMETGSYLIFTQVEEQNYIIEGGANILTVDDTIWGFDEEQKFKKITEIQTDGSNPPKCSIDGKNVSQQEYEDMIQKWEKKKIGYGLYPAEVQTLETVESTLKDLREFLQIKEEPVEEQSSVFEKIPQEFVFTSGAGGWETVITINSDGTFTGEYKDSEMGDTGENYPNGTMSICNFKGKFTSPKQVDEYIYSMKLEYLEQKKNPGDEYYEEGTRYLVSEPYGFDHADEFLIYFPGIAIANLPDGFTNWLNAFLNVQTTEIFPHYGIYNVGGEEGFVSYQ